MSARLIKRLVVSNAFQWLLVVEEEVLRRITTCPCGVM
jgi:hypothetical protein